MRLKYAWIRPATFSGGNENSALGGSGALDSPPWDAAETGWVEALFGEGVCLTSR
jgi:hypothetical protein